MTQPATGVGRCEVIGRATLYLGDCREILPTLRTASIDLILSDPPFSVPVKYHAVDGDHPRSWGDMLIMEPFFSEVLQEFRRLAGDGQVYVHCDADTYPIFYRIAYSLWPQSQMLVWYKPTGRRGRGWLHSHELILHLRTSATEYAEGFRQNVIGVMPVRTMKREHPAEKPGDLLDFIGEGLAPGERTVLDAFMGSGTTILSALRLGHKAIGIEIEPAYFDIACRRIEDAQRQGSLFETEAA